MTKSLPTIDVIVDAALQTAKRFPLVLAAGVLAAVEASVQIGTRGNHDVELRLVAAATLALPLLFAVTTLVELRDWRGSARWLPFAGALGILAAIAWQWGNWSDTSRAIHYALFSVAFHLAAAFLAQARRAEPQGFWQFNRVLFQRLLTTALYVAVLFAGLAAALGAIDVLFKANVHSERYGQLFCVDAFAFGTWFLLAGLPQPLTALDTDEHYPDSLRKFTQYLLIPLVVVYLLILTTYLGKVVVTREWPSGWIGNLVSFVTVTGMLAWLLVRPLEERPEFAWVRRFSRGFYLALLPSIVMLWMAIGKRIGQYGLTERRTIAVAGALWLSGIALFYIVSRSRNIKVIPVSLCICVLAISAGPLSAFSLSRHNQISRLQSRLERNALFSNGKLVRSARVPADSDVVAIGEAVWYLRTVHGPHVFDAWLADSVQARIAKDSVNSNDYMLIEKEADLVVGAMGLPLRRGSNVQLRQGAGGRLLTFSAQPLQTLDIDGYQFLAPLTAFRVRHDTVRVGAAVVRLSSDSANIELVRDGQKILSIAVDSLAAAAMRAEPNSLQQDSTGVRVIPAPAKASLRPPVIVNAVGSGVRARLVMSYLSAQQHGAHWYVQELTGSLMVDFRSSSGAP